MDSSATVTGGDGDRPQTLERRLLAPGESSPSKDIHEEEEGVVATEVEPAVDIKGHSIKSYSYAYIYIYI